MASTRAPQVDVEELERETSAAASGSGRRGEGPRQKSLTIGAVCKALAQEFPDISISTGTSSPVSSILYVAVTGSPACCARSRSAPQRWQ